MPVAWACRPPGVLPEDVTSDSEDCAVLYIDHWESPGDDICTVGEDPVYMIVDSDDVEDEIYCADPDDDDPPEGALDCDSDDDGENDIQLLSGGNRSWLDLDGGGGGASSLIDWVEDGLDEPIYPHTWFAGQTGVAVSVYKTVHEHQLGNDVIIPVFDAVCPSGIPNNSDNCPGLFHDHEDPPGVDIVDDIIPSGGSSTDYFHVISFAIFRITCVQAGSYPKGGDCPAHEAADLHKSVKTIEGCFIEDFDPNLGGGGGTVDMGAYTLFLVR
jgi:hypothetical protein